LLGLQLSAGLIDQTIRQSAGQVALVEDLLLQEIERAGLLHLDETPWRQRGQLLWLWVFNAVTTVVYFIGARSAEIFINALQGGFAGCLMSDGYEVYRSYLNRIRCLAHLLRKARGLTEATCRHTSQVGQPLLDLMGGLIQAPRLPAMALSTTWPSDRRQPSPNSRPCANATNTVPSSNSANSAARCSTIGKRSSGRYPTPACRSPTMRPNVCCATGSSPVA